MRPFVIAGIIVASLALGSCNDAQEPRAPAASGPAPASDTAVQEGTAVQALRSNPEFSTLVEALTAADLIATLEGTGPFTIFAPTNTAFEKIPAAERRALLQSGQRQALQALLTRHIAPGRLMSVDLASQAEAAGGTLELTTVEGSVLRLSESDGQWTLVDPAGARSVIAMPDVAASNGVVHAVDTVLAR